jgi:hypothetical protein
VRIDRDRGKEPRVVERHDAPTLAIALGVQSPVQGDSIDPSEELTPPLELRKLVIRLEKGVLCDVVGVACLTGQGQRQGVHAWPVFADQLVERRRVSGFGSSDELGGLRPSSLRFRYLWFSAQ